MFASNTSAANGGATYIEDVFSTYLYTGNGSTQTITNGIDLSTKGGLVWIKRRNAATSHVISDSARGLGSSVYKQLFTDLTSAQNTTTTEGISSFNSSGFTLTTGSDVNSSSNTYASWTFRKQPKFFDVVTYTGTGAVQNITHNLGSEPGCIIVKSTSSATNWAVYHRGLSSPSIQHIQLNTTSAALTSATVWNSTAPTSTQFSVGNFANTNANGETYVAYLFAHNAGGFGLTGTDNVISCGSYTGNGSATGPIVTLGYEPQWLLVKPSDFATDWSIIDNMRGAPWGSNGNILQPNLTAAETQRSVKFNPTGFQPADSLADFNRNGNTYIYIAIRRGPMKVPTSGTSVLGLSARSGTSANATVTGGAGVTDLAIIKRRNSTSNWVWTPRLAGTGYLSSNLTAAETAAGTTILQANPWDVMDGIKVGTTSTLTNASGSTFINYLIDRAPSFMDVVCYTGTGATINQSHNLGVPPELIFFKSRSAATGWRVIGNIGVSAYDRLVLQTTAAATSDGYGSAKELVSQPTSSVLSIGTGSTLINSSGVTFVAYLFATCAGVSKVGSYTGNGSTQTINCGFTGGARFVLIKNTSAVENWQIFDTARGMVAGTDPELRPNTTDTEVNVSNMVYTATTGFELVTSNAVVNGTGNSYIFLAIA